MIESDHFHLMKYVNKILSLDSEWSHISVKVQLLNIYLNSMCYKSFLSVVVECLMISFAIVSHELQNLCDIFQL